MAERDPVGIKIDGAKELRKIANRAGSSEAKKALRAGHKAVGGFVTPVAKRKVNSRTGKLEGSVRALGSLTKAQIAAGGARVPYAGVNHYGWPDRGMAPNPFLVDAVVEKLPDVVDNLEALYLDVAGKLKTT